MIAYFDPKNQFSELEHLPVFDRKGRFTRRSGKLSNWTEYHFT